MIRRNRVPVRNPGHSFARDKARINSFAEIDQRLHARVVDDGIKPRPPRFHAFCKGVNLGSVAHVNHFNYHSGMAGGHRL